MAQLRVQEFPDEFGGDSRLNRLGASDILDHLLLPNAEEPMELIEPLKPITVTHQAGLKFVANVRGHRIETDQPHRARGSDSAPTPLELLGAALGSCIALYVQQFCEVRDLPYAGMRVEVRQRNEANPARIGKFYVRLIMPEELPPQYAVMLARVVRSCPVHTTLAHGAGITVDFVNEPEKCLAYS